jgi:hypothetical protein
MTSPASREIDRVTDLHENTKSPVIARATVDGIITSCNAGLAQLLNASPTDIIHSSITRWIGTGAAKVIGENLPLRLEKNRSITVRVFPIGRDPVIIKWKISSVEFSTHEKQLFMVGFIESPEDSQQLANLALSDQNIIETEIYEIFTNTEMIYQYPDFIMYLEMLLSKHISSSIFVITHPENTLKLTISGLEMLGIDPQNLPPMNGLDIEKYIHPEDLFSVIDSKRTPLQPMSLNTIAFRIITPKGTIRHLKQYQIGVKQNEKAGITSIGLCIDETKDVVNQRTQETLIECLNVMVTANNESSLLAGLTHHLVNTGKYRYVAFYDVVNYQKNNRFDIVSATGDNRWLDNNVSSILTDIVLNDLVQDSKESRYIENSEPGSLFSKIHVKGKLVLIIGLWSDEPTAFSGYTSPLFTQLIEQIEFVLGNFIASSPTSLATQRLIETMPSSASDAAVSPSFFTDVVALLDAISAESNEEYSKKYDSWSQLPDWTIKTV